MHSRYKASKIVKSQDTPLLRIYHVRINTGRFTGKVGMEWLDDVG